ALDVIGGVGPVSRADLSVQTRRDLATVLEPGAALDNPVISHAPLGPERLQRALGLLAGDANVDGVLVLIAPDALSDMSAATNALAQFSEASAKPIISCFLG